MRDAWKWVIGAVVAVAVLVPVGTWIYINVIEGDPPAKLTLDSAGSGQSVGTTTTVAAATSNSTAATTATTPTTATATATPAGALTFKPAASSIVGYRVNEVLFGQKNEAVGRTSKVTGSMTMDGAQVSAVDLTVDMKSVSSDNSQRDGQFHGRIMATSTFPTATFKLTQPLVLSSVPTDSTVVNAKATGDLTLHGVTKSVTFDLAAQRDGANIKVNGTIPVVFADYKIANPSAGPATTEDHGVLEFLVVFEKA
jgi:polyisoprenoid-binding protein YceI